MQLEKFVSLGQYGHLKRLKILRDLLMSKTYETELPLDNLVSASLESACPHVNRYGGLISEDCCFNTGHEKME